MKKLTYFLLLILMGSAHAEIVRDIELLNGGSSHIDGPNCWNTAMVVSGLKAGMRFASPEEWLETLSANCVEVETPQHGDIGRLYHAKDGEVHGFIHLDDETIFAKHGESSRDGHKIMSYQEMLNQYGRTRNCRISNDYSEECYHLLKYYRCDAQESFRSNTDRIDQLFEEILFSHETKWSYKETCQSDSYLKRNELLLAIKDIALQMKANSETIEPSLISAYRQQLYTIKNSIRNYRCEDRRVRDEVINGVRKLLISLAADS